MFGRPSPLAPEPARSYAEAMLLSPRALVLASIPAALAACSRGEGAAPAVRPDPAAQAVAVVVPPAPAERATSAPERHESADVRRERASLPPPFDKLGAPCEAPSKTAVVEPAAPSQAPAAAPQVALPPRPPPRPLFGAGALQDRCGKDGRVASVVAFGRHADVMPKERAARSDGPRALALAVADGRVYSESVCIACRILTETTTVVDLELATDAVLLELQKNIGVSADFPLRTEQAWRSALAEWAKAKGS